MNTEILENDEKIYIPTLESIIKLFDSSVYRVDRSKLISDVFEAMAISISNRVDRKHYEPREQRYMQLMKSYQPDEQKLLYKIAAEIFPLCSSCTHPRGRFNDWLGELYMQSNTSNAKAGQFFTPFDVSKAAAQMALDPAIIEDKKSRNEILSISEPACGSGGMILAALDVLWNKFGFNYAENVFVEAGDIDSRCVHMCYIQLSLAGVPAIVKQQDALSRQMWSVWYTPAYLFQYLRFRHFEECARI